MARCETCATLKAENDSIQKGYEHFRRTDEAKAQLLCEQADVIAKLKAENERLVNNLQNLKESNALLYHLKAENERLTEQSKQT